MGPKDDRPDGHGIDSSQKNSAGRYILGVANAEDGILSVSLRELRTMFDDVPQILLPVTAAAEAILSVIGTCRRNKIPVGP